VAVIAGLHFRFLDPSPQATCRRIAHRVTAEYSDLDALRNSRRTRTGHVRFENVPVEAARFLTKHVRFIVAGAEAAQDG